MNATDFNQAVIGVYPSLQPYAIRLTRDMQDAMDLVQDTVVKAFTNRDKYRHDSNLKAWLLTMMRNIFINGYRKRSRRNTVVDNSENGYLLASSALVDNEAFANFARADIDRAIKQIPYEYRRPITMRYEGYKYQEIADEMKVPLGTIKSRIFLARKRLTELLQAYGDGSLN